MNRTTNVDVEYPPGLSEHWPNHLELPCEDGAMHNMEEHPQGMLLTDCITPVLQRRFPDGQYCIAADSGIYWRRTTPPERGALAPDWFLVLDVPPTLDGRLRRSYVMWEEEERPFLATEFVSGDGSEERDRTPETGKFWVYERRIRPTYYAIYDPAKVLLEVYRHDNRRFRLLTTNERGHYPIDELGAELGLWDGTFQQAHMHWLRWYDEAGRLLPTGHDRAEHLAERLRALGLNPDEV